MSKLVEWLSSFPWCTEVKPVTATIAGVQYEGAAYRDSTFDNRLRYYLLGDLPKAYLRSTKTAFVIDGADWYIACYMKEPIADEYKEYHPCGKFFMLCQWAVPSGEPIDRYYYWRGEKRSYNRIPCTIA